MSLDTIAYELREGRTLSEMIEDYPAFEGEERAFQGAIDYIRANQAAVDAYLVQEEEHFAEMRRQNPPPASVLERIRKYRAEKGLKSA